MTVLLPPPPWMHNGSSNPPYFNLTMFVPLGHLRPAAFACCLLLYSAIVVANLVIVLVVSREKSLHEPMYVFVALLSLNSLYGSSGFFPRLLLDLLSDSHLISRAACFAQIYVIYTYASYEMTILAAAAYDRFLAVCQPLHYHAKMSGRAVRHMAAAALLGPAVALAALVWMSARLPLCGDRIHKVFCANWNVVKLSCVSTEGNNAFGLLLSVLTAFLPLLFVLYTYGRIVAVCWRSSAHFRAKAFNGCLPHVLTYCIYTVTAFCDVALSRHDAASLDPFLAAVLSLEFVVIPPLLNPLVYGLKLPHVRRNIVRMLLSR